MLRLPALADALLEGGMAAAIEAAVVRHALDDAEARWRPGEPLKLLLVGYLGTRNTGADVRVAEMIRQLRAIVGDERLELTLLTSDARLSAGYFPGARQLLLPDLFVPFLAREVSRHHGVVACEGSMFKSKFSNALTTLMAGALGLAAAQNKLAIGYGAEAGAMDPPLRALVGRYCKRTLIVCRNEPSRRVLEELGVPTAPGTDTAWSFDPGPPEPARARLRAAGWDGRAPVLVACPINPFWWPVRPRAARAVLDRLTGLGRETRYRSLYYHDYGPEDRARFERYLDALAAALGPFARERGAFVAVVGMERLDRAACEGLAARLGGAPTFVSDEHDMFTLVGLLWQATWLVSSRYHALVCSTAAGVPGVGVSMDERIENLLTDRGQRELCLEAGADDLAPRLTAALERLAGEREALGAAVRATLPRELERMGRMGQTFAAAAQARYPELALRAPAAEAASDPAGWRAFLPPLTPAIAGTLEHLSDDTATGRTAPLGARSTS